MRVASACALSLAATGLAAALACSDGATSRETITRYVSEGDEHLREGRRAEALARYQSGLAIDPSASPPSSSSENC